MIHYKIEVVRKDILTHIPTEYTMSLKDAKDIVIGKMTFEGANREALNSLLETKEDNLQASMYVEHRSILISYDFQGFLIEARISKQVKIEDDASLYQYLAEYHGDTFGLFVPDTLEEQRRRTTDAHILAQYPTELLIEHYLMYLRDDILQYPDYDEGQVLIENIHRGEFRKIVENRYDYAADLLSLYQTRYERPEREPILRMAFALPDEEFTGRVGTNKDWYYFRWFENLTNLELVYMIITSKEFISEEIHPTTGVTLSSNWTGRFPEFSNTQDINRMLQQVENLDGFTRSGISLELSEIYKEQYIALPPLDRLEEFNYIVHEI